MNEGKINRVQEGDRVLAENPVRNGKGQAVVERDERGLKPEGALWGLSASNDHQIYRLLSLCPPFDPRTIPPWVLLCPFCVHGGWPRFL